LAAQIALDLAKNNQSVLIIPTEEPPGRIGERCARLMTSWEADEIVTSLVNVCIEHHVPDVEQLPAYILRQVISPGGLYHGRNIKLVIVDSVQGWGLSSASSDRYERLFESVRLLSAAKITTLLINHVTKRNELAGPRTLEHAVDAVLLLRKTPAARLMFCLKNRFGPADLRSPLALSLDPITLRLNPSPLSTATIATARTYLGIGIGITDVQAAISLSGLGRSGRVTAPGLPKAELQQLIASIAQLPGIELDDLDFCVRCRLPGQRRYTSSVGLALAMALLGSYLQKPIPPTHLYRGEIDLARNVRAVDDDLLTQLLTDFAAGADLSGPRRIFVHPSTATSLPRGDGIETVACERLDQAVYATWPDLR
jgi:DNA repair protein RadA/Sms